jgi:hypothetical protein
VIRGLVVLALLALATRADAQTILDYVTFDGIDYVRWAEEPGRALSRDDLGLEFAVVECSFGEDRVGCPYGLDGSAAFMPAGTRLYAVRGYRTDFRLAAIWRDRIFLYQAWRNPKAKLGADLFDIGGRVRTIDVARVPPTVTRTVSDAADREALTTMILRGAMRPPRGFAVGPGRYWLTIWLTDGTTLGRPYFADTGELLGGLTLPDEFGKILERYLRD